MSERALAHTMRDALKRHGHHCRIENMAGSGMPDVNICINGIESWVELKFLPQWPRKLDTVVEVKHYTMQQRRWHEQRHKAGGRVYILLEVGEVREYLLFPGMIAATVLGYVPQRGLKAVAIVQGQRKLPIQGLLEEFKAITPYQTRT